MNSLNSMKTSFYNVFSDVVNDRGDSILFSTRSSKIYEVSAAVRMALENENYVSIPESIYNELVQIKALVPREEDELYEILLQNKQEITSDSTSLYEVIQPTAYCQLGCDYCGQNHTKDYICEEVQNQLVSRVEAKLAAKSYKQLSIGWFGGEPLVGLKEIRSLTRKFLELCRKYDIQYTSKIVTNGLSLKPKIYQELVNELFVNGIEITLDGTAEYHDLRRHTKAGGRTFDIIYRNLQNIFRLPDFSPDKCSISIRCNVDSRNAESIKSLIEQLGEDEFYRYISYFYLAGIYSWGGNDANQLSLTKEEFADREIGWFIDMFKNGFNPSLIPGRVKSVCMTVSETSDMYDAFGNIFNCTEVSYSPIYNGRSQHQLGNLQAHGEKRRHLSDWNDIIYAEDKYDCQRCPMLPVCGGGCPKSWDEGRAACPPPKFNIKDRLALAYAFTQMDESISLSDFLSDTK